MNHNNAQGFLLWQWLLGAAALLVLAPLITLLFSWTQPLDHQLWQHLVDYLLWDYLLGSIGLVLGVAAVAGLLGTSLAWCTAMLEFPGRRFLSRTLILPMALPGYVLGFVYLAYLEPGGFLYLGFSPRQGWVAVLVMGLSLYPYVYMLMNRAFVSMGSQVVESAQSLGLPPRQVLWQLALPLGRPFLVGSLCLVAMETLADFGTVSLFSYDTFTTAIYKAWYGMGSLTTAVQLACFLVLLSASVLAVERRFYSTGSYHKAGRSSSSPNLPLTRNRCLAVTCYCWGVFLLAFVWPVGSLLVWSSTALLEYSVDAMGFVTALKTTGVVASLTAICVVAMAFMHSELLRWRPSLQLRAITVLMRLGYALPGAVLAVGVFWPLSWADHKIYDWLESWGTPDPGSWLLSSGLWAMVLGLFIRFYAVGLSSSRCELGRLPRSLDEAAAGLGRSARQTIRAVHHPLLRRGLIAGGLLVFVDTIKEMPLTLMTRPAGWDTLAVKVFQFTSEGEWERAALPASLIVLAGAAACLLLSRESSAPSAPDPRGNQLP